MKGATKYVALDVHQAMTVATVREEGGKVLLRSIFPTEEPAILEFFQGMRGSIHVTFEEGTQAQWLHDLLVCRVDRVLVCDRRGEKRHGRKDDQTDADELSELLRRGGLRAVYHGSPHRSTLRELTRTYQNVVEDSTRVMLRLKALFRAQTKRNLWAYCGLAMVTHSSSDYELVDGRVVRKRRAPMTRGLNRNYNRELKDVFKGAATAATGRPGPLLDYYEAMVARGMRPELARVTLTRKLTALTLRLWKKGEHYDPAQLTKQAR